MCTSKLLLKLLLTTTLLSTATAHAADRKFCGAVTANMGVHTLETRETRDRNGNWYTEVLNESSALEFNIGGRTDFIATKSMRDALLAAMIKGGNYCIEIKTVRRREIQTFSAQ